MPPRFVEVPVKPTLLKWARESVGLDIPEISKKLKVSEDVVTKWESGQKRPTLIQIEKLASIYKRPLAIFFLSEPPKDSPLPNDFRTLPEEEKAPLSPETRLAIRRAWRANYLAAELSRSLERETIPKIERADLSDDPESVAAKTRETLGVQIESQFGWKNQYEALNEWRKSIEDKGIFVFQMGMPIKETRGFSLTESRFPVIVLNTRDSVTARIFTLFHEYGHILLNKSGICDMEDRHYLTDEIKLLERFCNHFAGSVLVPKEHLLNHELVRSTNYFPEWPDEVLRKTANDFKVSQEVILRKLLILGMTEEDFYRSKREQWKLEIRGIQKKKKGGRQIPPRKCIQENGVTYVSLVLDGYRENRITYSEVADYLSIQTKHLRRVEQLLRGMI